MNSVSLFTDPNLLQVERVSAEPEQITLIVKQDFLSLFPEREQPGKLPFRLALVTILQFIEGLSDRGEEDAARGRIDWKYLLCLELDDPGFDHSILCEFRARSPL
jgi:transposase